MKNINLSLQAVEGYLISITRNTLEGWYEIKIGIPNSWVFNENDEIKCEVVNETTAGKIINLSPKNSDIIIDDLIAFIEIIIITNEKIAEKEKEFTLQMEDMKKGLEKKASEFFKELDDLKENSFKKVNEGFVKNIRKKGDEEKKSIKSKLSNETPTNNDLLEIDKEVK